MEDSEKTRKLQIKIASLERQDIEELNTILIANVRDETTGEVIFGEVETIENYMGGGEDEYQRARKYLVAKDETGRVVGCAAYAEPDPDMVKHFNLEEAGRTIELLNMFVSSQVLGKGVGRKLFEAVCKAVRDLGKEQLVVNSGPRYKNSWGFYDRVCDQSCGFLTGKYGSGRDAKTWKKKL
jgi:predicted N-acetyltransferase YhbS